MTTFACRVCTGRVAAAGIGLVLWLFLFSPTSAQAGPASKLVFYGEPLAARAGFAIVPAIEVQVQDAVGARVLDYTGNVTLGLKPDTGSYGAEILGTLTVDVTEGYAWFPDVRINTGGVGYVLVATSEGLTPAESYPFHVTSTIVRVALDGDDRHDGSSWDRAKKTIAAAVLQTSREAGSIWLKMGNYSESLTVDYPDAQLASFSLYGGFTGTEASPTERICSPDNTHLTTISIWRADITMDSVTLGGGSTWQGGLISLRNSRAGYLQANTNSGCSASHSQVGNVELIDASAGFSDCDVSSVSVYEGGFYADRCRIRGGGIHMSVLGRTSLKNCLVTGCDVAVTMGSLSGLTLENTTMTANGTGVLQENVAGGVTCVNSIVAFNGRGFAFDGEEIQGEVSVRTSCLYGNAGGDFINIEPVIGTGVILADPDFVDQSLKDYHLSDGSPCIDAGDDKPVQTGALDLDGRPRIQGSHVDMGAYEYNAPAPPFTLSDAGQALRVCAGLEAVAPEATDRLDVSESGSVDAIDVVLIARKVSGLEPNP